MKLFSSLLFIVLFVSQLKAQTDSSFVKITEIKKRLAEGGDFCELAFTYSEDKASAPKCGEIGFFGKGDLMLNYEKAMVALKPGETSDVIKTGYGYHIIQLLEVKDKKYRTRHILIKK
jgi:parvulin-like peptidyl-prolyl isomerase